MKINKHYYLLGKGVKIIHLTGEAKVYSQIILILYFFIIIIIVYFYYYYYLFIVKYLTILKFTCKILSKIFPTDEYVGGACMNCSGINAVAIVTVTASGMQYSENTEKN